MSVELVKNWYCPNCSVTHVSQGPKTAFHNCSGFNGNFIPLVIQGSKVNNVINLREDYLGDDLSSARTADGSVISSISHETDEGIGATIYLPCATFGLETLSGDGVTRYQ